MKKEEVIDLMKKLDEIKNITDRQEYLVSKEVNLLYNQMKPILNEELKRMDNNKIECNCPQIYLIKDIGFIDIQSNINQELERLVKLDYKIIDYNINLIKNNEKEIIYIGVIKYTS